MNNYQQAAEGYRRLLTQMRTPEILAEAARVFNANDQLSEAESALAAPARERDNVCKRSGYPLQGLLSSGNRATYAQLEFYGPKADKVIVAHLIMDEDRAA